MSNEKKILEELEIIKNDAGVSIEEFEQRRSEALSQIRPSITTKDQLDEIKSYLKSEEFQSWRDDLMVSNFEWPDEEEVNCEGNQPECDVANVLLECGTAISQFALNSLNVHQIDNDCADIPITVDIHDLLQERMDEKWDLESRIIVFEAVQSITNAMMGCMIAEFSSKIAGILDVNEKIISVESMMLLDSLVEVEGQESPFYVSVKFRISV